MTIGLIFWIVFLMCLLFGGWLNYPFDRRSPSFFIVMLLIFLLGWAVFGFIVRDGGPVGGGVYIH